MRLVLEEVLADFPPLDAAQGDTVEQVGAEPAFIQPVRRAARAAADRSTETVVDGGKPKAKKGLPASLVYGGLAALVVLALGVVFMLPEVVEDRGPIGIDRETAKSVDSETTAEPGGGPDPAASEARRKIADEVLGELLEIDDRLRSIGVELWGGSEWAESRRAVETGDKAYRGRDYAGAAENYRRALTVMKLLEPQSAEFLAAALRDAQAAFDIGDQIRAVQNFELALAIEADNTTAKKGLKRARNLDQVIELMSRGAAFEESGDLGGARSVYQQVLALDSLWQPARDNLARISTGISRNEYETQMASGFSAMAQENFSRARAAFTAALAVRPGDAEANSALRQLDAEEQLRQIASLRQAAITDEQRENWAAAVQKYAAILAIDGQLADIEKDRTRSQQRLDLHQKLIYEIGHPERFNEDNIWNAAKRLLERARATPEPGVVLSAQMKQLDELLKIASVPVPVNFQSDNLTDVAIYKVGSLGSFLNRTVDLKPGAYVAVGTRDGYRDVRRSFTVEANGNTQPVVLSCEDAI